MGLKSLQLNAIDAVTCSDLDIEETLEALMDIFDDDLYHKDFDAKVGYNFFDWNLSSRGTNFWLKMQSVVPPQNNKYKDKAHTLSLIKMVIYNEHQLSPEEKWEVIYNLISDARKE